jgi:hypothetical protein
MKWQVLKVLELVGRNLVQNDYSTQKNIMKKELHVFYTAPMFYPTDRPKTLTNPDYLNKASRYFPLIGWIVEGLHLVSSVFNFMMTPEIAVIFSMIAQYY